jgi:hypothetical protein
MTAEALTILEGVCYIILVAFMSSVALFMTGKTVEESQKALEKILAFLAFISTPLRKVFDPGNIGAVPVQRIFKIDPAPVDAAAEAVSDAIDKAVDEQRKV